MVVLGAFIRAAEAKVWVSTMGGQSAQAPLGVLPLRPDIGLDKIYIEDNKLWVKQAPDPRLTMNIVGSVTRVPTVTSLPLCCVLGEQLYMEGGPVKTTTTSMAIESFVPAWLVPLAATKPKKQKKKSSPDAGVQGCFRVQVLFRRQEDDGVHSTICVAVGPE